MRQINLLKCNNSQIEACQECSNVIRFGVAISTAGREGGANESDRQREEEERGREGGMNK